MNTPSCLGTSPAVDYIEVFTFIRPNLSCSITDRAAAEITPDARLLTGIDTLNTVPNGNLFSITVAPLMLPENFGVGVGAGVRIDIALTSVILKEAMPEP